MLPAAASIRKQGANRGATSAFLVATPESGVDSISVTYALLDPLMTVMRPFAAFCTAIAAGILENVFFWEEGKAGKQPVQPISLLQGDVGTEFSSDVPPLLATVHIAKDLGKEGGMEKMQTALNFAINNVWGDIAVWFFIGTGLAALISILVPDALLSRFLGGGLKSMLIMLLAGVPLYICATASTPIAAALILKGVSPGAALVFLLVGPATNVASLSVLCKILGKKSTVLYLSVVAISAVFFGLAVDGLYKILSLEPRVVLGTAEKLLPFWLQCSSVLLLFVLSVHLLIKQKNSLFGENRK